MFTTIRQRKRQGCFGVFTSKDHARSERHSHDRLGCAGACRGKGDGRRACRVRSCKDQVRSLRGEGGHGHHRGRHTGEGAVVRSRRPWEDGHAGEAGIGRSDHARSSREVVVFDGGSRHDGGCSHHAEGHGDRRSHRQEGHRSHGGRVAESASGSGHEGAQVAPGSTIRRHEQNCDIKQSKMEIKPQTREKRL